LYYTKTHSLPTKRQQAVERYQEAARARCVRRLKKQQQQQTAAFKTQQVEHLLS